MYLYSTFMHQKYNRHEYHAPLSRFLYYAHDRLTVKLTTLER